MSAISQRETWCLKVLQVLVVFDEPLRKTDICRLVCDEENGAYISGMIDGLIMSGHLKSFKSDDLRETWVKITFLGMRLYDELSKSKSNV